MTHLVDTSVWHKYGSHPEVKAAIDHLALSGSLFTTCAPVIAEYCFSAKNPTELADLQEDMHLMLELKPDALSEYVSEIQSALWNQGRTRAAGAVDTLIAAYAIGSQQVVVSCDQGFAHISRALQAQGGQTQLSYVYIGENGSVTAG